MYSQENDQLSSTVSTLHEEIRQLRSLLMSHKDCPVGHAQGIGHYLAANSEMAMGNQHVNPYGMAMGNGAGMQRGMQQTS
jgi:ATF/CREB family transcription factor